MNAYLNQNGDWNLLVDVACSKPFGPTCRFLHETLTETGMRTDGVTDLLLKHLHPDHIAIALNSDATAIFECARLQLVDTEHEFWMNGNFDSVEVNGTDGVVSQRLWSEPLAID